MMLRLKILPMKSRCRSTAAQRVAGKAMQRAAEMEAAAAGCDYSCVSISKVEDRRLTSALAARAEAVQRLSLPRRPN